MGRFRAGAARRVAVRSALALLVVALLAGSAGWAAWVLDSARGRTTAVPVPDADTSWGRLSVQRTLRSGATLRVDVRLSWLSGTTGRFDPSDVTLLTPSGVRVGATAGTLARVDIPHSGGVRGALAFVLPAGPDADGAGGRYRLVVVDGEQEVLLALPAAAGHDTTSRLATRTVAWSRTP